MNASVACERIIYGSRHWFVLCNQMLFVGVTLPFTRTFCLPLIEALVCLCNHELLVVAF
jgi:hypothetical protein